MFQLRTKSLLFLILLSLQAESVGLIWKGSESHSKTTNTLINASQFFDVLHSSSGSGC